MSPSSQGWRKQKNIPLGLVLLFREGHGACARLHAHVEQLPSPGWSPGTLTGCSCQSPAMLELATATAPAAPLPWKGPGLPQGL